MYHTLSSMFQLIYMNNKIMKILDNKIIFLNLEVGIKTELSIVYAV